VLTSGNHSRTRIRALSEYLKKQKRDFSHGLRSEDRVAAKFRFGVEVFYDRPEFNSSAMLVTNQLASLSPPQRPLSCCLGRVGW